jgi:hypothetical protein
MVLRRQPDGEWRITHRMWDDSLAEQSQGTEIAAGVSEESSYMDWSACSSPCW